MTSPSKQNESSERIKKILQGINSPANQTPADLPEENSQKINEEVDASKEEIRPTAETELIPEETPEFSDAADALEKSSTSDENFDNGLSSDSTSVGSDSGNIMEEKDGDKIPENNSTEPIDSEIIVPVENGATVSEEMTGTNDAPNSETEGLLPLAEPSREETDSGVITETKEPIIKRDETDAQEASLEEPEPLAPKLPSGDETEPTFEGELPVGLEEEIPKEPEELKEAGLGIFKKGKKPKKEKPKTEKEPKEKKEKYGLFSGLFAKKEPEIEFYDFTKHGSLLIVPEPEGKEVVEEYWIEEGCSKVQIVKDVRLNQIEYLLFEPPLTQFEHDLLERIYEDLRDVLILEDTDLFLDKKIFLLKKTARLYNEYGVVLEPLSHFKLQYYLVRNYLGWARLEPVLQDTHLEDISCDGFEIPLFLYHRTYQNIRTNIIFSEKELLSLAITLAQRSGKHISISTISFERRTRL